MAEAAVTLQNGCFLAVASEQAWSFGSDICLTAVSLSRFHSSSDSGQEVLFIGPLKPLQGKK